MYRDLPDQHWQDWWKISRQDKPDVLILWGIFKSIREEGHWLVPDFLRAYFGRKIKNLRPISPHALVGDYKNLKIAVTHAYGGAFSGDQVQHFIKLGTRLVILMGHFGGLRRRGLPVGQIFFPSSAYRADGTTYYFLGRKNRVVYPSKKILNWLKNYCRRQKISYVTGPIRTVSTMLGETKHRIQKWQNEGFVGVDLESAVAFTIAKYLGVHCVSILHHSDHVGGGHLLTHATAKDLIAKKAARKLLVDLALKTAEQFGKQKEQ